MSKIFAATTVAGALGLAAFCSPATAASSSRDNGVSNSNVQIAATEDVSARRRYTRRYRAVRVYRAPASGTGMGGTATTGTGVKTGKGPLSQPIAPATSTTNPQQQNPQRPQNMQGPAQTN